MKILIIEDDPAIRLTLQEVLELNAHTVLAAPDGATGIALAREIPELIFCDIGMPGIDGFQVMAEIKQMPPCRDIPFIFLTARANRDEQRKGMSHGADDYITKPFSEQDIINAIAARTQRLRPLRERIERLTAAHQIEIGANWSHELLTPLNGILGGLELIEAEADHIQPAELRELLALVRTSAERQQSLSRKIVYYFDLERLRVAKPMPKADACTVAEAILDGASRAAQEVKRLPDLIVRCDPGTVPLTEAILSTAVAEVVGNAFRFSLPGQLVTVNGSGRNGHYLIEITDQGPGMTAEQCAKIGAFAQFERGAREQQGLGLGLAIARSAAEIAGGQLSLASDSSRGGLQVTFTLPCQ